MQAEGQAEHRCPPGWTCRRLRDQRQKCGLGQARCGDPSASALRRNESGKVIEAGCQNVHLEAEESWPQECDHQPGNFITAAFVQSGRSSFSESSEVGREQRSSRIPKSRELRTTSFQTS